MIYNFLPALENIERNVMTSRISSQVPILQAPAGIGLLENLIIFILST